ncbi:MAG: OmpH family outer membrane protein [Planctomycetota bacterium]|nr:OmpH family outer membrane protein [Planctomycetota bacterium]
MQHDIIWRWALVGSLGLCAAAVFSLGGQQAEARRATLAPACCVATIDLNGVLEALEERKVREGELQEFIKTRTNKLDEIRKKMQAAQDDMKVLPEKTATWFSKREEAAGLALSLRGEEELAKALVEDKRKTLSLELFDKIKKAAAAYGGREGYLAVFSDDSMLEIPIEAPEAQVQNAMISRRVLYKAPGVDITQAVAQMMNNEFKAQ